MCGVRYVEPPTVELLLTNSNTIGEVAVTLAGILGKIVAKELRTVH